MKRRRSGEVMKIELEIPKERESGIRLRDDGAETSSTAGSIDDLRAIASAAQAAHLGFDVCARRARTKDTAQKMIRLAGEARAITETVSERLPEGVRRPTTSERMRWEWLASTAALLDGGAEGRLSEEANRHLTIALSAAARVEDHDLVGRLERLAATSRADAA
jgi:hypothetical protein